MTTTWIPENELHDFMLTAFKDENGQLLFDITHISQLDWSKEDFKSVGMDNIFHNMKSLNTRKIIQQKLD